MTWVIAQIVWRLLVLKTIKEQVRRVVQYSQNIPDPQVDELIDKWFNAKRDFMEVFGGLIWEYPFPVTFHISQDSKERRLENLVQYISDEYGYEKLCRFILPIMKSWRYCVILLMMKGSVFVGILVMRIFLITSNPKLLNILAKEYRKIKGDGDVKGGLIG